MTVPEQVGRNDYVGNGSLKDFAYTFAILDQEAIAVYVDSVLKTLSTDYTVSGVGGQQGGTVSFVVAPASGKGVAIISNQPIEQLSDYFPNEDFPASRIEQDLDKIVMIVRTLNERLTRAPQFPAPTPPTGINFDPLIADKFAQVKSNLTGVRWVDVIPAGSISVPVSVAQGGTGETTIDAALAAFLTRIDARTNTVSVFPIIVAKTTSTPSAGIGTGLKFQAESADEDPSDVGQIEFSFDDVSAGSEDSRFSFLLRVAGAALARAYNFLAPTAFAVTFTHAVSAPRTYTLPNKDGTVATLADVGNAELIALVMSGSP